MKIRHLLICSNSGKNPKCQCGLAKAGKGQRIVGGHETAVNEFPWQARLEIQWDRYAKLCGGSLISDRWVLTAYHCTVDTDNKNRPIEVKNIKVFLGAHNIKSKSESRSVEVSVAEVKRHPDFGKQWFADFDFALLKMKKYINFSKYPHISPICLPENNSNTYDKHKATVTGWGHLEYDSSVLFGQNSDVLRKVELEVISNTECMNEP